MGRGRTAVRQLEVVGRDDKRLVLGRRLQAEQDRAVRAALRARALLRKRRGRRRGFVSERGRGRRGSVDEGGGRLAAPRGMRALLLQPKLPPGFASFNPPPPPPPPRGAQRARAKGLGRGTHQQPAKAVLAPARDERDEPEPVGEHLVRDDRRVGRDRHLVDGFDRRRARGKQGVSQRRQGDGREEGRVGTHRLSARRPS